MLGLADPVVQGGEIVVREDRHRLLGHDRPAIEGRIDEVHRAARDRDAVLERVAHGMGAGERRQQARVGVEDPSRIGRQDGGPDDPHVAGQDDDVRRRGREHLAQRGVVAAGHEGRVDPLLGCPVERRTGPVGHHDDDRPAEVAALGGRMDGAQVRARARDRDGDPTGRRHATDSSGPST